MLENLATNWPYLVMMGVAAGFLSGLIGIGGGLIMVPMLLFFASAGQKEAQGMSLGYMILTALVGFLSYKYKWNLYLDYRVVGLLTLGGIVGASLGSYAMYHIPTLWLSRIFACFMIVVAVKMLLQPPVDKTEIKPANSATSTAQAESGGDSKQGTN